MPIALAVKRQQLAHELWHYKYDADGGVRRRLEMRLAALLWRFLGSMRLTSQRQSVCHGSTS